MSKLINIAKRLTTNDIEGLSYKDFTFTVYHEMAHIIYDTKDEVVANSFALLYNNKLWDRSIR